MAEALSILAEPVPGPPSDPEEANFGLRLLDTHHVAPQSWLNTALNIMVYREDDIPEEEFETYVLSLNDSNHIPILARQKVERCGALGLMFPEHFYWR